MDHALDIHLFVLLDDLYSRYDADRLRKAFKPRILLLVPSATLILLLLHMHERTKPLPSLLGVAIPATSAGTVRLGASPSMGAGKGSFSATTGPDGESLPVAPPKEAESGVDYYMSLQAIQNLMGLM